MLSLPGLAAENVLKAGEFFGICGFASVDWVNCEWSCQYLGVPCSPVRIPLIQWCKRGNATCRLPLDSRAWCWELAPLCLHGNALLW